MKQFKKIISFIVASVVVFNFSIFSAIHIYAHPEVLNVVYDDCIPFLTNKDGMEEKWYVLNEEDKNYHYSHTKNTIKYYFHEIPEGHPILNSGITRDTVTEIKMAFESSMKKWNNVYFYSYNSDGSITKNKVINIVEGTADSDGHDISIYFTAYLDSAAKTTCVDGSESDVEDGANDHKHFSKYKINISLDYFYANDGFNEDKVAVIKERTGAHEFGHVLGLKDVDANGLCGGNSTNQHHEEILMGYGEDVLKRATEITYKDIAGVAITRGFHTDDDHKWLHRGSVDGKEKLICSICNGVKHVDDLSGYEYDTYGECNNNHKLESGNMMAVASYGDMDYYKCKYCRYVAPFSYIEEQDYSAMPAVDGIHHICTNNVSGLNYSFLEEHTWVDGECSVCGYEHPHTWEEGECTGCGYVHPHMLINGVCAGCGFEHDHDFLYMYRNGNYHFTRCDCGYNKLEPHFIRSSQIVDGRYANCLGCGRRLDLWEDSANVQPTATSKFSVNGSYILPNGIVVLVDEDIEAYMNGTLVFYNRDDIPTVE